MTSDGDVEPVHGVGSLFRDLEWPNPEARKLKAIPAGQALKVLGDQALTICKTQALTGIVKRRIFARAASNMRSLHP